MNLLTLTSIYMKMVITLLLQWVQQVPVNVSTWDSHQRSIFQRAKGKSQQALMFKLIYTEYVHGVWIERNLRIFEKKSRV
ncbi:hypothetical protein RND71_003678 [Anisodus tanguticus]|uniref:Secreted protein n=1 Tax=Anisodus tanguticus TaxID=243964 RepID=A0AAE1SWD8_9SOLA|nr:hypothetical protein RND71_003678 [Anisodus tanguticus]